MIQKWIDDQHVVALIKCLGNSISQSYLDHIDLTEEPAEGITQVHKPDGAEAGDSQGVDAEDG